jgi:hypothetical protein
VGGLLVAAVIASPATAATILPESQCYQDDGDVLVAGVGFEPGALVTVAGTGISGQAFADPAGNVRITATARPFRGQRPDVRVVTLTATDGLATAQTTVRLTNISFSITPVVRRPNSLVHWTISGLNPGERVYAHYIHKGREERRILFGHMPSPCSVLRARVPMLPVAQPDPGRWIIQLDNSMRYSPNTLPRLRQSGTIRRR